MERISVKEAAEMLGMERRSVIDLVTRGEFGKAVKKDRNTTYIIYREQIIKWLGF